MLTKDQAIALYKESFEDSAYKDFKEFLCATKKDIPTRSLDWGYYTDCLCKDGEITENQYNSWTAPYWCKD